MSHPGIAEQAYKDLIVSVADSEPPSGWDDVSELPMLLMPQAEVVLAHRPQSVLDQLSFEADDLLRALRGNNSLAALAVRMTIALEQAARQAIWRDVFSECERRREDRGQGACA